jgi:cyclopropane fatty-acyl-phospholipid synthase-like methyltransferase
VLDAGCGTGENALHVASLRLSVLGVDVAETALAIAREKADDRGIQAEFAAVKIIISVAAALVVAVGALTVTGAGDDRSSAPTVTTLPSQY